MVPKKSKLEVDHFRTFVHGALDVSNRHIVFELLSTVNRGVFCICVL